MLRRTPSKSLDRSVSINQWRVGELLLRLDQRWIFCPWAQHRVYYFLLLSKREQYGPGNCSPPFVEAQICHCDQSIARKKKDSNMKLSLLSLAFLSGVSAFTSVHHHSITTKLSSTAEDVKIFDQEQFIAESKEMRLKHLEEQAMYALKIAVENYGNAVFPNAMIAGYVVSLVSSSIAQGYIHPSIIIEILSSRIYWLAWDI